MNERRYETILVETGDGIATITLNRPERLNAFTQRMGAELFGTLADLDRDDAVRAIVVTGAGKHFCAGADLDPSGNTFSERDAFADSRAIEKRARPWNMTTPVIAAINGGAVGIGATIPLTFDIRICSTKAKIGFVFVRRGILPEYHSTWLLPRLIGMARAMELFVTGRILLADEALAYGLVSRVVEPDQLLSTARDLALDIAKNTAPVSVAVAKRLVWRQLLEDDPIAAKQLEDSLFDFVGKHADSTEGVRAFLEKRDPKWTGSASKDLPESIAALSED